MIKWLILPLLALAALAQDAEAGFLFRRRAQVNVQVNNFGAVGNVVAVRAGGFRVRQRVVVNNFSTGYAGAVYTAPVVAVRQVYIQPVVAPVVAVGAVEVPCYTCVPQRVIIQRVFYP